MDSSGATSNSLRPDVLLWLPSGVLALKDEDKTFGVGIEQAREDLRKKMNVFCIFWQCTLVPYQIAYACSGSHLEFRAFVRTNDPRRPQEIQLTDRIDLSTVLGRSLCVRYAINIARILLALHGMNPSGSVLCLGKRIHTPSSTVMLVGEYVTKTTSDFTGEEVFTEFYEAVKNAGAPHLIRSMEWVLIDLERANYGNLAPLKNYNPTIRPPESHDAGFYWTASTDMWQFGKLLESWNQLDQDGRDRVRRLLQDDFVSRPSASQALDHAFFSNTE